MPIKVYDTNEKGIAAIRRRRALARALQVLITLALSLGGLYLAYRLVLAPAQAAHLPVSLSSLPSEPAHPPVSLSSLSSEPNSSKVQGP